MAAGSARGRDHHQGFDVAARPRARPDVRIGNHASRSAPLRSALFGDRGESRDGKFGARENGKKDRVMRWISLNLRRARIWRIGSLRRVWCSDGARGVKPGERSDADIPEKRDTRSPGRHRAGAAGGLHGARPRYQPGAVERPSNSESNPSGRPVDGKATFRGRLVVRRGFPNSYTGCPLVESAIGDIPAGLASFVIVHCNGPMSSFGDDDENSAEHRLKGCQRSYRRQLLNDTVISGNEHDA